MDKGKLERLIRQSEDLDEYSSKFRPRQYRVGEDDTEANRFSNNERKCIKFVIDNADCSKQEVVDYFAKERPSLSRRPVWNMLTKLIGEGILISIPDTRNSQIHKLTINKENIIGLTLFQLDKFGESFSKLLQTINDRKIGLVRGTQSRDLLNQIITVYVHVLNSYIAYTLLEWPNRISDNTLVRKLFDAVIVKMSDILVQISEITNQSIALHEKGAMLGRNYSSVINHSFVENRFLMSPYFLLDAHVLSKKIDMKDEVYSLIKEAWKISSKLYPYVYDQTRSKVPPTESLKDLAMSRACMMLAKDDWRYAVVNFLRRMQTYQIKPNETNAKNFKSNSDDFIRDNKGLIDPLIGEVKKFYKNFPSYGSKYYNDK